MANVSIELTEEQKKNLLNLANLGEQEYLRVLNQTTGLEMALMFLVGYIYKQQRTGDEGEDQYLGIHEAIDETLADLRQSRGKIHNDLYDVEQIEHWMKFGIESAEDEVEHKLSEQQALEQLRQRIKEHKDS